MINPTREQIAVALFLLLQTTPGIVTFSRRPQLWDQTTEMPALYMGNTMEAYVYQHGPSIPGMITLDFNIAIFIRDALDPNVTPDTALNNLLDAVEATITPTFATNFKQTLGGIVDHAWIEGDVERRPGYLDGQGAVFFTIKVLVPS